MKVKTNEGEIEAHFTGGTWQEVKRGMVRDKLKAELVPHMPDIIETGKYRRNELHKERTDNAVAFHEFRKTVDTRTGPCEVIVDVAESVGVEPKYSACNMAHEGSAGYTKRLTYDAKENGVISVPSGHSAGEISPALYGFPNLIMRDDAVLDVSNILPRL